MNTIAAQFPELPTPSAVLERTWRATWFVGESKLDHGIEQHAVYTADQMHQYARDYAAALSQTAGVPEGKRDREGDRLRFPDPDFNAWLDAGISDAGHTVYDSISSIEDAWQGWHGHVLSVMLDENPDLDAMLAAAPAARVDDRVQRLIDEARRCAGSTGDLSDLRAALMPFEGDY